MSSTKCVPTLLVVDLSLAAQSMSILNHFRLLGPLLFQSKPRSATYFGPSYNGYWSSSRNGLNCGFQVVIRFLNENSVAKRGGTSASTRLRRQAVIMWEQGLWYMIGFPHVHLFSLITTLCFRAPRSSPPMLVPPPSRISYPWLIGSKHEPFYRLDFFFEKASS